MLPLFLNLTGRRVVLVGGGRVAAAKLQQLLAAQADVRVVAPEVVVEIERAGVAVAHRAFAPSDLDGAWLVIAAATPAVNREVAGAAEKRHVFVNAVDDPANATAFLSGVVRRGGVTLAISTGGEAPGLTALLREALDSVLPRDLFKWVREAVRQRAEWRAQGVPMDKRRPLLLEVLNRLYEGSGRAVRLETDIADVADVRLGPDATTHERLGHVSLVGAGPGDPALLTRRAIAQLRSADLVLYDALIDERILRYARRAQRFFVGKRAGRQAMSQERIHLLMIRAARRGRRVVRLKGGDPFVLGRGGEEALALAAAGVAFDIVPGVTSAVAAPALAGIPVTHRGLASAFLVVSGHDTQVFASETAGLRPNGVTLVVLMGVGRGAELAAVLVERGWDRGTPVAIVVNASLRTEQVWRGTLDDLAANRVELSTTGPGTLVIGEVAALADRIGRHADRSGTSGREQEMERAYVSRR